MAKKWDDTISTALQKLAKAVADAATLEITTQFVEVDPGKIIIEKTETEEKGVKKVTYGKIVLNAYTRIDLVDGDYLDVVPVKNVNGEYEVATELYALHKTNVAEAREYIEGLVTALVGGVQSLAG